MERSHVIIFLSFVATFIVLHVLFGTLEGKSKQSQMAPFNTVVEYFCSDSGTQYLITQNNAVALHVNQAGDPVLCKIDEEY